MKAILSLLMLPLLFFTGSSLHAQQDVNTQSQEVKWMTVEQALAAAAKTPKPIFMDLYTSWCGYCKKLDAETFTNPVIAEYLNANFYPVKFNAEQRQEVTFRGKNYKPDLSAGRHAHPLAIELTHGKLAYPNMIFMDPHGEIITTVPGYLPAKRLEPILNFIGSGAYQKQKWENFYSNFIGEIK